MMSLDSFFGFVLMLIIELWTTISGIALVINIAKIKNDEEINLFKIFYNSLAAPISLIIFIKQIFWPSKKT